MTVYLLGCCFCLDDVNDDDASTKSLVKIGSVIDEMLLLLFLLFLLLLLLLSMLLIPQKLDCSLQPYLCVLKIAVYRIFFQRVTYTSNYRGLKHGRYREGRQVSLFSK